MMDQETTNQQVIGSLIWRAVANETLGELAYEFTKALAVMSLYFETQSESDEFLQVTHNGLDTITAEMRKTDAAIMFKHNQTVQ
jgi:hypothetical protein